MDKERIGQLLKRVAAGRLSVDQTLEKLKHLPYEDLTFARIDHHRALRQGAGEVIFCQGKTPAQVQKIFETLWRNQGRVLATRADEKAYRAVKKAVPSAVYHRRARLITAVKRSERRARAGERLSAVPVMSAGTADIPVAEEAALTLEFFGQPAKRIYDVGVAGLHRLIGFLPELDRAKVIVVVAGMEGALASILGGLVSRPIIAVPTSVGYGASFQGLAPLLTMMNSCAAGIGVVNIDNGFGAGYLAGLINKI